MGGSGVVVEIQVQGSRPPAGGGGTVVVVSMMDG